MGHAWEHIEHYDNASILNFYYGGGFKAEFGAPPRGRVCHHGARDCAKLAIEGVTELLPPARPSACRPLTRPVTPSDAQ